MSIRSLAAFSTIVAVAFLVQGCSPGNDLSRSEAEEIIRTHMDYPVDLLAEFSTKRKVELNPHHRNKIREVTDKWGKEIAAKGIGTPEWTSYEWQGPYGSRTINGFVVNLSEEALSLTHGKARASKAEGFESISVVTHRAGFGQITGISYLDEAKSTTLVEYTETHEPTMFADIDLWPFYAGRSNPRNRTVISYPPIATKKLRLRLYDDGWRVAD